jgi:hypothetical protein
MKIRLGFVSNSSTSSFCIYGAYISDEDAKNIYKNWIDGEDSEDSEDSEDKKYEIYNFFEEKASKLGLDYHHPEGFGGHYIGVEWRNIKGNETGNQFKRRIQKIITKFLGYKLSCSTCEEAYYS